MTSEQIERWITVNPVTVALKTGDRELADRVDILQRAFSKIPSYYNARAEFSRLALEQCTSEAVASSRNYLGGELAIDLTTGLGIDSYFLSKSYKKVISVELDHERYLQATNNFKLLKADNIETINSSAEEFMDNFSGMADIIFIDPARRNEMGSRIYDISKTQPNVISMLPKLLAHSREVRIKCSPMFDVEELANQFSQRCSIETISYDGECKEVVARFDGLPSRMLVTIVSSKVPTRYFSFAGNIEKQENHNICDMHYLLSFDVALVKSRMIENYMQAFYPSISYICAGSYLLSSDIVEDSVLTCRKISSIEFFSPSKLKKQLRNRKILVLRKGFPLSVDVLKKQIGFKEGGQEEIAFVQIGSTKYTIWL